MQYFNIQLASQLSGVASATIRAWEKRYNAVVPERGDNKHRLYSEKDIEKLSLLYQLTEMGQNIGKIAHLDLNELKNIYSQITHKPYEDRFLEPEKSDKADTEKILSNFLLALSAYKLDIISHELEKTVSLLSPRDLCLQIVIPLFQEIGRKVYNREFSIAQEHALSALMKFYLGQIIGKSYQKKHQKSDMVLITTPEGELHDIGVLSASLLCVHYGIKFIFLGASLPADALAETANALEPKYILLGATREDLTPQQNLEQYLGQLTTMLTCKPTIMVGGNLKPYTQTELEKKKIKSFSSLQALDEFFKKNYGQ